MIISNSFSLPSIATEKYLGLSMPEKLIPITRKCIHWLVALLWVVVTVLFIPYMYALTKSPQGYCFTIWDSAQAEYACVIGMFLLISVLPSTLTGVAYSRAANTIKVNEKKRAALVANASSQRARKVSTMSSGGKSRKPATMFFICFLVHLMCSLPYNMFHLTATVVVHNVDPLEYEFLYDVLNELNAWLSLLFVFNGFINCLVYAGMDSGFRKFCNKQLKCQACPNRSLGGQRTGVDAMFEL